MDDPNETDYRIIGRSQTGAGELGRLASRSETGRGGDERREAMAKKRVIAAHREIPPPLAISSDSGAPQLRCENLFQHMEALGVSDESFFIGLLQQLAAISAGGPSEADINFMLSVIRNIKPKDQIEVMLASQMAAVHMALMTTVNQLGEADSADERIAAEHALNRLSRTFAAQMEALKRYRNGGQQKVVVEHLTVRNSGQAIARNVSPARRSSTAARKSAVRMADQSESLATMPQARDKQKLPMEGR